MSWPTVITLEYTISAVSAVML